MTCSGTRLTLVVSECLLNLHKARRPLQVVPENKGREAKVRGICMVKRRRGYRTSFTLLNHIPGGGPVERSFPL